MLSFIKGLIPSGFPQRIVLGIVAGLVGFLLVSGTVLALVRVVRSWTTELYDSGYKAGVAKTKHEWEAANTSALQKQRDQVVADALNSNKAVRDYLAEIASREPQVIRVKERTTVYANSEIGSSICLDADGVQLLKDHRTAIGYTTGTETGTTR